MLANVRNTTKCFRGRNFGTQVAKDCIQIAAALAGGDEELRKKPNMITVVNSVSPLQYEKKQLEGLWEHVKMDIPICISSEVSSGATGPVTLAGSLVIENAEVLAGITLGQLVNPGTPALYGSVPVRARMDTLGDSYGSIETTQYNIDCVQMARFYNLPNYSTSGVCDTKIPGQQSTVERLFSDILMTLSGPQFLHCAFGLLDCNSVFCLLQAVLDDAHFKMIKSFLREPRINEEELAVIRKQVTDVVATSQKMFINYIRPVMRSGEISPPYPFEGDGEGDDVFVLANERMQELLAKPVEHIDEVTTERVFNEIPGLLPGLNVYKGGT